MRARKEELEEALLGDAVRHVLGALLALLAHDRLLVVEALLGERVEQEAHAVALQPERELELVGRDGLEVVGAVEVGRAVHQRGAGALEVLEEGVFRDVPAALEHDVLEEVGEAGAAGNLVLGADVVPEVDCDEGHLGVPGEEHLEAVVEHEALDRELGRDVSGLGGRGEGEAQADGSGGGEQDAGQRAREGETDTHGGTSGRATLSGPRPPHKPGDCHRSRRVYPKLTQSGSSRTSIFS